MNHPLINICATCNRTIDVRGEWTREAPLHPETVAELNRMEILSHGMCNQCDDKARVEMGLPPRKEAVTA